MNCHVRAQMSYVIAWKLELQSPYLFLNLAAPISLIFTKLLNEHEVCELPHILLHQHARDLKEKKKNNRSESESHGDQV